MVAQQRTTVPLKGLAQGSDQPSSLLHLLQAIIFSANCVRKKIRRWKKRGKTPGMNFEEEELKIMR
jgi:hypothetical protein